MNFFLALTLFDVTSYSDINYLLGGFPEHIYYGYPMTMVYCWIIIWAVEQRNWSFRIYWDISKYNLLWFYI